MTKSGSVWRRNEEKMEDVPSQSSRVAKAPVVPNPFGSVGLEWVPLEGPIFFPSEEVRLEP